MLGFVASGRVLDAAVVALVVEFGLLWAWRRAAAIAMAPTLAAGLCLMVALRRAVAGDRWPLWAFPLTLAGLFHLIDLVTRLRTPRLARR